MHYSLDLELQEQLELLAPARVKVPSGSTVKLKYLANGSAPVLPVRLQECFGLLNTPTVNQGKTCVLMHLLSPGYKVVQITSDLKSFWANAYFDVRKDLRIRYKKHSWPENPLEAQAIKGAKKKTNQKVVFDMHQELQQKICAQLSASGIGDIQLVQKLWGGYGELFRCALIGAKTKSIVVKYIRLSEVGDHPRGWNTKQSHERKLKSYQVETTWYNHLSKRCDDGCQIPRCLYQHKSDQEIVLVLEDLNEIGFPLVEHTIDWNRIETVLRWLANFHATFLGVSAARLWEVGTYWHLATRTDELNKLTDFPLKSAAQEIDLRLSNATHKTIVHGDAKLANFCFSRDGSAAAARGFSICWRWMWNERCRLFYRKLSYRKGLRKTRVTYSGFLFFLFIRCAESTR